MATNPDRRMRFLHWFGLEAHIRYLGILPLELGLLLCPQLLKEAEIFIGHGPSFRKSRQLQRLELFLHPPHSCTEDQPPSRQHVQCREDLSGEHRRTVGDDQNMSAQTDTLRAAGEEIEHRQRLVKGLIGIKWRCTISVVGIDRLHLARNDNMIGKPHCIKAQCFRLPGEGSEGLWTCSWSKGCLRQDASEGHSHLAPHVFVLRRSRLPQNLVQYFSQCRYGGSFYAQRRMLVLWLWECWFMCRVIKPENQVVVCILVMVCIHDPRHSLRHV